MGAMSRRVLFEALGVSLVDVRCTAHVEPEGPEEATTSHHVVLVRRGAFRRARKDEVVLSDANHVLFFNAGEGCRYAHPLPGGDDCSVLVLETPRALELVARHSPRHAQDAARPFPVGHGLSSPRLARLHYELLALVGRAPALMIEDALSELADVAVAAAYAPRGRRERRSAGTLRRRREVVEAVKLALNRDVETPPRLEQLARLVDCSPFHLSRSFRETAGVTLRRYAKRLRARAAAERLRAGARDLTELALELGYSDHSHFTNAFRQEWGVAPSRFRAAARA